MISDKQLKITIGLLGLTMLALVSFKISKGTKAETAMQVKSPSQNTALAAVKKVSRKLASVDLKQGVKITPQFLSETNTQVNELNLVDPRVCKKQSQCPYDLYSVYKQSIDSNSVEKNVLSFVLLQKKIGESDLPNAKKAELLSQMLKLVGQQLESGSKTVALGKKLAVPETAGLYLATLNSYVLASPSPRAAVENVYDSIRRSQDPFVNKMAVFLLMKHYPNHRERLVQVFEKSDIKGFEIARN